MEEDRLNFKEQAELYVRGNEPEKAAIYAALAIIDELRDINKNLSHINDKLKPKSLGGVR
jgi:hypothetical protein